MEASDFGFLPRLSPNRWLALVVCGAGFVGSGLAGEADGPPPVTVTTRARYFGEESIGGGGKATWGDAGLAASLPVAPLGDYHLGLDVGYDRMQFDFAHFERFFPGKSAPLHGANVVSLTPNVQYSWSEELSFVTGFSARYSGADAAKFDDSLLFGGYVLATYKVSPTLTLGLGFAVEQRLERSTMYVPIPAVDWRFAEHWRLSSLHGPDLRLSYSPGRPWTWFVEGGYNYADLRLRASSSVSGGVLRVRSVPISAGLEYEVSDHLTVTGSAGAAFSQQLRIADPQGNLLRQGDQKAVPFGALSLSYRF